MKHIVRFIGFTSLAFCVAFAGTAQAETNVRISLDWIPGSVHSPFFIALYKGYYKAEGLDVAINRGKGSVGLVQQMASGVYDMGYPDTSVLTDFDFKNPNKGFSLASAQDQSVNDTTTVWLQTELRHARLGK